MRVQMSLAIEEERKQQGEIINSLVRAGVQTRPGQFTECTWAAGMPTYMLPIAKQQPISMPIAVMHLEQTSGLGNAWRCRLWLMVWLCLFPPPAGRCDGEGQDEPAAHGAAPQRGLQAGAGEPWACAELCTVGAMHALGYTGGS